MCWHSQKNLFKNVGQLRKVSAFDEGAVKKVFASLEECRHSQKELLKKVG